MTHYNALNKCDTLRCVIKERVGVITIWCDTATRSVVTSDVDGIIINHQSSPIFTHYECDRKCQAS
jgi:hypothetical protein